MRLINFILVTKNYILKKHMTGEKEGGNFRVSGLATQDAPMAPPHQEDLREVFLPLRRSHG